VRKKKKKQKREEEEEKSGTGDLASQLSRDCHEQEMIEVDLKYIFIWPYTNAYDIRLFDIFT
jgi:hypothetical protein